MKRIWKDLPSVKIKKKKIFFLILINATLMFSAKAYSQYNLVPNPSFEIFDTCPGFNNGGYIYWAPPWTIPLYLTTPDYFNACDTNALGQMGVPANYVGYEPAHTGVAYAEVVTYYNVANPQAHSYREYIETELNDSLIAGGDYCIRFYVSPSDSCHYTSNNIGAYFSIVQVMDTCPVLNACNLPYIPSLKIRQQMI